MAENSTQLQEKAGRVLSNKRRYVGSKETFAYVLYDISASFNIDQDMIYITNIVQISLKYQYVVTIFIGIWDVINDMFVAPIVDRTRTRFGKFKPWLLLAAGPGLALSIAYWLMPLIFKGTSVFDISKLIYYVAFKVLSDLTGTVNEIAKTGLLSTITPDINERSRLITQAALISGFAEKIPSQIFTILLEAIDKKWISIPLDKLFVSAGIITSVSASAMGIFFLLSTKERVMQKIEKPKSSQSLRSLITNKPLLLITLSEFLSAFNLSSDIKIYYRDVLGSNLIRDVAGIPGAIVSPLSYSYVKKAREKFSTKTLWILSTHFGDVLMIGVFLVGAIDKNYKKIAVMLPAFMARETLWMLTWGLRSVIPQELRNESIDYGEWKNGYRTEGVTGVAKDIPKKLVNTFGASLKEYIMYKIGYSQVGGHGSQSAKTEYYLFMMCTLLPALTSLLGIFPKFFYDLSGEKRERMYKELEERRHTVTAQMQNTE